MAQQLIISGTISQGELKTPVPQAEVFVPSLGLGTVSDHAGRYTLVLDTIGVFPVQISALGFVGQNFSSPSNRGDYQVDIVLDEEVFDLPAALITDASITGGLQQIRSMPGAAYYLSAAELSKFGHTDAGRVLGAVPGVNIQEEDGFGLRPNIGLRGSGVERSSKITIMEDGVLTAPAPYAAPSAYYFPTIGRMHGVEILKGSSQIKYGPYTTGGALNLISAPIPAELAGNFRLSGGSFTNRSISASVGNTHRNVAYMVETFHYGSDGFKQLDGASTGFDKKDYLVKIRLNTNPDAPLYQSLTIKAGQTSEDADETYLGLTDNDFSDQPWMRYLGSQVDNMRSRFEQLSLRHAVVFNENISLQTIGYRNRFHRNWYKSDKVRSAGSTSGINAILGNPSANQRQLNILRGSSTSPDEAILVKANNRDYRSDGIQSTLRLAIESEKTDHQLEVGIRIHEDAMDRFQWVDEYAMTNGVMQLRSAGEPGTESNRIEEARAIAVFTQYKFSIGAWNIFPGLRYENVRISREDYGKSDPARLGDQLKSRRNRIEIWLPGLGIEAVLSENHRVFAGAHRGFAPPGSNAGAQPEASINYELGWRYQRKSMSAEVVGFFNDYQNLLGADLGAGGGSGSTDTYNGGAAEVLGFEGLAHLAISPDPAPWYIPVNLGYTYTFGKFLSDFDSDFDGWGEVRINDRLPYLAPHTIALESGFVYPGFSIYVTGRYRAQMRTSASKGRIDPLHTTDAHLVLDAAVNARIARNVHLFASIKNLADNTYIVARRPAGVRPGLPRTFEIGIDARL